MIKPSAASKFIHLLWYVISNKDKPNNYFSPINGYFLIKRNIIKIFFDKSSQESSNPSYLTNNWRIYSYIFYSRHLLLNNPQKYINCFTISPLLFSSFIALYITINRPSNCSSELLLPNILIISYLCSSLKAFSITQYLINYANYSIFITTSTPLSFFSLLYSY